MRSPLPSLFAVLVTLCAGGAPAEAQANRPIGLDIEPASSPAGRDILSLLPARASAVVVLRDPADLDSKLSALATRLGVPFSPLTLAKGWLEIVDGLDEHRPAAVAILPNSSRAEESARLILIIPVSDRARLLSFLNPQPPVNGTAKVTIRGRDGYVAVRRGFAIFAPSAVVLKEFLGVKEHLSKRLTVYQRERFNANDLSLWMDPVGMESRQAGEGKDWRRAAVASLTRWLRRTESVQLSARVEQGGLALELLTGIRNHRGMSGTSETTETLLSGIPDEPFVLAIGMNAGPVGEKARALGAMLVEFATSAGVLDAARSADLVQTLDLVMRNITAVSLSLSILPEGPDGRLGLANVLRTSGSGQALLVEIEAVVRALKSGLFVDPTLNRAVTGIQYRRNAETSSGVAIDQLELDLSEFEAVDQVRLRQAFGEEGLMFRIGVVDKQNLVVSFGGGIERFDRIVRTVRAGRAPVATDPGMMMSALGVARERSLEAYFSVDRAGRLLDGLAKTMGSVSSFPIMPETNAPAALAMHAVEDSGWQFDLFIPTELMVALRNILIQQAAEDAMVLR